MPIRLRFFFDWGIGCLWAADDESRQQFGYGPLDLHTNGLDDQTGTPPRIMISNEAFRLRDHLADESRDHLNPIYPLDPSLWRQERCDKFNANTDRLLAMIRRDLGPDCEILDVQERYREDPRLAEYLRTDKWAVESMKTGRTRLP